MTQNPQVPRCRSSVATPPRTIGEGPWLAIPDFSNSTMATPVPGADSRVLECQVAASADGCEPTLPPPASPSLMAPSLEETPPAVVVAADAMDVAREIVASPGEQSSSPVDTGTAVRELLQNSTTGRLRRWVQWGANDPRKAVTVLGGVALALLVVLRGGSTVSRPAPSPTPEADQLSREVQAIERLSSTPLRLASAPATAPAATGGNGEKDSLFEVKLLQTAKVDSTAVRSPSVGAKEAPLRELSAAASPDPSGNQQAADVRPVAATQDRPSPSDAAEASPADPAHEDLGAVREGEVTREEPLAPRRPARTKGYPSTDAVKYPAYRFEGASQNDKDPSR